MVLVVAVNSRIERPCVNDRDAWRQPSSFPPAHGSGSFPLCELCLAYRFARGRRTVGVWLTISHRQGTRSALPERSPRSSCCGGAVRSRVDRPGHRGEEPWSDAYVHISIRVFLKRLARYPLTAATDAALLAAAESSAWRRMRYQPSKMSIARSGDATASGWSSTAPLALTMPWRPLNRISGFSLSCHTHSDCQKFADDKRTVRRSGNSSVPPPTQRG